MPEDIRITDLVDPVLNDFQKAVRAYGDTLELDFTVDGILAQARAATGLDDFGPDDYLERLGLLVDEWSADDGLTGIGKLTLWNKLTLFARSRLVILDYLKAHPEVHDVEIERPIIVAGLPRSGTTHLLNLMAADSQKHSLPLWESYEPLPMPNEEAGEDGIDPRYARCAAQWDAIQKSSPLLPAMHPLDPDHIHEELELMGPNFASYNFEWLAMSPRWRDDYYAHDQTPHYEYMKTVLKILQSRRGPGRWVLKCPQHLEQLPVLRATFPDATFAVTHRDPVSVIQSAVTMLAYGQRNGRKKVQVKALVEYWSDRVEHLLRACVRDRDALPEAQSIDIPFHEFMADDMAMVERIYEKAGEVMTDTTRAELRGFIDNHPRGKYGRVIYALKDDFGVDPEELRERFSFYFDAFPVKRER
ncbi:MAG: sulfotransferase [Candidatus Binatia bacterium]|nr:sulfotransferase [Candidatus Binatia bacterium]